MTDTFTARMLLSHNHDVEDDVLPSLTRTEFAAVFGDRLSQRTELACQEIEHAHWVCEIRFDESQLSPEQVGELCAQALLDARRPQLSNGQTMPDVLILGGKKSTPVANPVPNALLTGEWGVDVVETPSGSDFLGAMNWDAAIAARPEGTVFKVEASA
ncbi:MAG: DUF2656 family protein [Cyanobacteria bacterium J06597_1]